MATKSPRVSWAVAAALTLLAAGPAEAGVIVATNNTIGLFDASSGTRTVTFTGLEAGFGTGVILDVDIAINFAKADGESFDPPFPTGLPFHNETVFRLERGATTANLISAGSFNVGSDPFDGTITFSDQAAQVVNVNPDLPQAGTFRPVGPGLLSGFNGQNAAGTFTLFIQDTVGLDALRFRSFTLTITTEDATNVIPEPSTMALAGVGALVLGAMGVRRRKHAAKPAA